MKKIRPDDNRYDIIRKFDESIDEFFVRTKSFHEEMVCIADSDEDNRFLRRDNTYSRKRRKQ